MYINFRFLFSPTTFRNEYILLLKVQTEIFNFQMLSRETRMSQSGEDANTDP
jgi:hypothetical protein